MRKLYSLLLVSALFTVSVAFATETTPASNTKTNRANATKTLEQNIKTPVVPAKAHSRVSSKMESLRKGFENQKFSNVKLIRNNEVVVVTLLSEQLFIPNETGLIEGAELLLKKFENIVNRPHEYRVVIAVYTDDTGDTQYSDALSNSRAEALLGYFTKSVVKPSVTPNVNIYGMGESSPISPNTTIYNRSQNRRVEFYIIPEEGSVETPKTTK